MTDSAARSVAAPLAAAPEMFRPDPHAAFARLRPLASVVDFGRDVPQAIRHKDVAGLMNDPRTRQLETESLDLAGVTTGALRRFYENSMLTSNPPAHPRRRRPAARAFAHKMIQAWRPRIRALVGEMIEAMMAGEDGREADFVEALAAPLPSRLIGEIVGAPEEDASVFREHVYAMSRGLGGFRPEDLPRIEAAAERLIDYVARLLEARRAAPREDFLSDYLAKVAEGDPMTEIETVIQIVAIILAGSDTTRLALSTLVAELLQRREQWDAVVADPALAPGAALEAVRFEPPVGSIARVAVEPVSVDGVAFEPGAVIGLSILSAQRDEAVYRDPQSFDVARSDHPKWSVSFGMGAHRCLGEALARAELEEALVALTQRAPGLEIVGPPPRPKGFTGVRGAAPFRVACARR